MVKYTPDTAREVRELLAAATPGEVAELLANATPGEWTTLYGNYPGDCDWYVCGPDGVIANMHDDGPLAKANAELCAAAPRLLRAHAGEIADVSERLRLAEDEIEDVVRARDAAESERDALKAEVERLRRMAIMFDHSNDCGIYRSLDECRAAGSYCTCGFDDREDDNLRSERDQARARVAELEHQYRAHVDAIFEARAKDAERITQLDAALRSCVHHASRAESLLNADPIGVTEAGKRCREVLAVADAALAGARSEEE